MFLICFLFILCYYINNEQVSQWKKNSRRRAMLSGKCCRKCGKDNDLSRHHIYPRRFFGNHKKTICFCIECHEEIEKLIPFEKQDVEFYRQIVKDFLGKEVQHEIPIFYKKERKREKKPRVFRPCVQHYSIR